MNVVVTVEEGHILTRTASDAAAFFPAAAATAAAGDKLLSTAVRTSLKLLHHVIDLSGQPPFSSSSTPIYTHALYIN
uniref:Uncharacterized protein n=1 Tax=Oryza meridionalis TaxID=40149 RepID=A0A0E0CT95_9ORYZ